ncbi:MAG: hypothetical protein FWH26_00585 [Oscillospiraceae bacterium]|nr:hypothetical protein [Oscillospiraceae bacterium]
MQLLADGVRDIAASDQTLAYAKRDTRADGTAFASFFLCDWETLQSRPIPETAYLQLKFGGAGSRIADYFGEIFSIRAARLPDGGCAILCADGTLHLFRPDGQHGAAFPLFYREQPAFDIAYDSDGGALWFSAPQSNALVQFSLSGRETLLRAGGPGVFPKPMGLCRQPGSLQVCCSGAANEACVKEFSLADFEVTGSVALPRPAEKFICLFGRRFAWIASGLYAF